MLPAGFLNHEIFGPTLEVHYRLNHRSHFVSNYPEAVQSSTTLSQISRSFNGVLIHGKHFLIQFLVLIMLLFKEVKRTYVLNDWNSKERIFAPRLTAIRIIKFIYKEQKKESDRISPRAVISTAAKIGKNCSVGDFSAIGDNCEIGDNTIMYDRVSILENSKIGRNCIIQPGVVIGADGFAYERLLKH